VLRFLLRGLLAAPLAAILIAGLLAVVLGRQLDTPGPLAAPATVAVPHGSTFQVGQTLAAADVVSNARSLRLAAALTHGAGPLHAGEFAFPARASLGVVLAILRTSKPIEHKVTIPEGLTAAQIAQILDDADALAGEVPLPQEGTVLPDTYIYERGTTRAALLARASEAMRHMVDRIWADRATDLPLATSEQMVTLASIVERETARAEERPRVAAVFLNRLRRGMRLQADPTVAYAVSGGTGVVGHDLTRADLEWSNPYNTYRVAGLPPGPIASPGVASMQAVARPAETDDLYFVADGSGGHAFARTEEEHNRNVARWRALPARDPAKPGGAPAGPPPG
jgi:UPF0755 protein